MPESLWTNKKDSERCKYIVFVNKRGNDDIVKTTKNVLAAVRTTLNLVCYPVMQNSWEIKV